ncbi:MAG: hypothetical protein ACRENW_00495, partial [Thermodesulfobacteriota bacterium]
LQYVKPRHLYGCTNCGMAPMARPVAEAKLRALAAGAAIVRRELAENRGQARFSLPPPTSDIA